MNYDFFISYCREEITSTAYPLYRSLTKLGFNVWMDRDRIVPGQQIYTTIDRAISASSGIIAIIATPYLTRPWTVHELEYTLSLEKEREELLIPIYHNIAPEDVWDAFPSLNGRAYEPLNCLDINSTPNEASLILDRLVLWYFRKSTGDHQSEYDYTWLYQFENVPHISQLLILLEQCHFFPLDLRGILLGYDNAIRYLMAVLYEHRTTNGSNKTLYVVASRYCSYINNRIFELNIPLSNTMLLACKNILRYMCEELKASLNSIKGL